MRIFTTLITIALVISTTPAMAGEFFLGHRFDRTEELNRDFGPYIWVLEEDIEEGSRFCVAFNKNFGAPAQGFLLARLELYEHKWDLDEIPLASADLFLRVKGNRARGCWRVAPLERRNVLRLTLGLEEVEPKLVPKTGPWNAEVRFVFDEPLRGLLALEPSSTPHSEE